MEYHKQSPAELERSIKTEIETIVLHDLLENQQIVDLYDISVKYCDEPKCPRTQKRVELVIQKRVQALAKALADGSLKY